MDRITDAWNGLGRRERVLAGVGVAAIVLLLLMFFLLGGEETAPVDASTTALETAAANDKYGPVKPQPGMIVAETVPDPTPSADAASSGGVAGLTVANADSDGGDATAFQPSGEHDDGLDEQVDPRRYEPPVVSEAVKAAGRDLERVAKAYRDCMDAAIRANKDQRHCPYVLKYGVFIQTNLHSKGGVTLTKLSSDGHQLDYTVMPPPQADCRALDKGNSCDAWTAD